MNTPASAPARHPPGAASGTESARVSGPMGHVTLENARRNAHLVQTVPAAMITADSGNAARSLAEITASETICIHTSVSCVS